MGDAASQLKAEGNYYVDSKKMGVGFHGDEERRKVIGVRLGNSTPLQYQWFHKSKPIGQRFETMLNGGDIYIMSSKAVGHDYHKSSIITLRHAAGAPQYLETKTQKAQRIEKARK